VVLKFLAGRCSQCRALALIASARGSGRALAALDSSTVDQKVMIHNHIASQYEI
jgi:hypothetical protein